MASVPKKEIAKHYRQDRYKNRVWLSDTGSKMEGLKLIPAAEGFPAAINSVGPPDLEDNLLFGEEL
jgi:hypothetical protein